MSRSSHAAVLYAALGAVHVAAAALRRPWVEVATKPLLLPALALYAMAAHRERGTRCSRRLLLSLALACAGGAALRWQSATGLTVGMGFFFAAYAIYTAEFIRSYAARRPRWWLRWLVPIGYGTAVTGTMAWLWRGLGDRGVAVPMAGYAGLMAVMASTAVAWGWRTGLGAGLLLASDTLIGVGLAGTAALPGESAWVMATYLAGLGLVVDGWTTYARPRSATVDSRQSPATVEGGPLWTVSINADGVVRLVPDHPSYVHS
jgi:uncharacterized membrane protein YhhN